ncbi:MAG: hypothetical protein COX02_01585 [Candidatus Vogelbacteria bacterium CG22_combo_CG10-13_8_21_14_all_37_9]|uniref:Phosphatidic acid phosphatase type 2/haloperoxidase domain-containing protein n=1 Tax=Candidatus Vogelbacteria bacterium CG22_combo_CG10-13_8_21_14_all_37_9 TaxID=1975046 RepID=A0A2H0BKK0_9BACT|nr:MAG: hypothetical protein BK005_01765 [bacterium CG10_37_50]PIP58206.1 MAG: hypothetical protein COX02_01585 [Candidatus Vogelbacteria bacterium CG22_combo_CG10-13_8_21_14_all_37_9]
MDKIIFLFLYHLSGQNFWFDQIILFLAQVFPYFVVGGILLWCLFKFKRPLVALLWFDVVFISAVFTWFLASLLKYNLVSPRPFIFWSKLQPLFLTGGLDSFPSGHAVFLGALAGGLLVLNRRFGIGIFSVALLIGLARVIAGVHWPSDVVAGLLFGTLISYWLVFLVHHLRIGLK